MPICSLLFCLNVLSFFSSFLFGKEVFKGIMASLSVMWGNVFLSNPP